MSYRILIADDNETNRRILVKSLGKAGYETIEAANGAEAVTAVGDQHPDLILLDVDMPGMNGFEVCEVIKGDEQTDQIPVIFITAHTAASDVETAFSVGGSDYVTKPFHLSEVKARVSVHLTLRAAQAEIEDSHVKLLKAQKLESIGQLAAGIAHEINTPTQFIGDNLRFLQEAFVDLSPVLSGSAKLCEALRAGEEATTLAASLAAALEEADVEYLAEEVPRALEQSMEGNDRVSSIVRAMKEFSHPGVKEMTSVDMSQAIGSTLTVARNEWKYVAEVTTEFDESLPPVTCMPGEVNQVILNMIVNAAHAIVDANGDGGDKGQITITTKRVGDQAEIRVQDSGTGIPEHAREKIFDPFFTTKDVGKGTGQGLSIAHEVIVHGHGGELTFETELGQGTTFIIRLPLQQASQAEGLAA